MFIIKFFVITLFRSWKWYYTGEVYSREGGNPVKRMIMDSDFRQNDSKKKRNDI